VQTPRANCEHCLNVFVMSKLPAAQQRNFHRRDLSQALREAIVRKDIRNPKNLTSSLYRSPPKEKSMGTNRCPQKGPEPHTPRSDHSKRHPQPKKLNFGSLPLPPTPKTMLGVRASMCFVSVSRLAPNIVLGGGGKQTGKTKLSFLGC
jgi:hypothetical protein